MGGGGAGTLIVSIDLELDLDHQDESLERRLDELRGHLVAMTESAAVPATWAVADPSLSAATEAIVASGVQHEMAVLGDQAWLGTGCGRARLERELDRRFTGARRAGLHVSTLALRNVEQVLDLDLLLDHGVTAVRGPAAPSLALSKKLGTPPIRFGIWHPPIAWQMPERTHWWTPTAWLLRRQIRRAIRRRTVLHLAIDANRLIESGDSLATIEATLHYAAAKREAGQLAICTIGQLARLALGERSATPSRSVLRAAA